MNLHHLIISFRVEKVFVKISTVHINLHSHFKAQMLLKKTLEITTERNEIENSAITQFIRFFCVFSRKPAKKI